ncbi:7TM diverse intracellular signaling domain-containing protein, partial [Desulfovibrio piger]|uniref:sensor histidine kinase n=1 Tax=Desulfovibrio piger TaxID=901 RepID=UPI003A95617B
ESQANWRNLLPLPLPAETPQVCFIRLDGQPPLWFAPTLRSLDNLASAPESLLGPGIMLALAVVMLLALLRGITERGQWRFWTALYVGAALTHAVLGGPDLGAGNITPADAVSAMAPGLALMFLAHLARHLMQTPSHSRLLDIQYLLLSLPGAVLALLPLWPDFSWMGRFLPLWPMLALIFVPTTLGAWLMGVPGARRFLLGCLVAALGAGLAVLDLGTLLPPFVQGTLPLWGTALSALIIAGMSAPGRETGSSAEATDPLAPGRPAQNQTITDPNLRLLDTDGNTLPLMTGLSQPAPAPATVEAESASATAIRRLEQALAAPLREIVEQNRQLEQCALPHDARSRVESMGRRARQALRLLHDPAGEAAAPATPPPADTARAEKRVFDLRKTLRQTHETCRALAEKSDIALGWHVPADLEQLYEGPAGDLEDVLRLLLEDAVRASKGGKIHFAVRRVPDSKNPGHLLFQVRDTGTGLPPEQRSASLLARIWELSSSHGGFLGVESGPRGTSVIFTLQLHLPEASDDEELPTVLVCAPDAATRRELGAMLRDLPCTYHETGTLAHGLAAGARKGRTPAAVLLICGPEASVDAAPLLRRYHSLAERTGPFGAVALTPDQSQWDALAHAGFSHALTLPVAEDALRETVLEILGSHDDVADLGAPLPESRQAEAPLPDLFGPAPAPQADQGMPDLLLSTDDVPQQTAPAAPAATSGDLPDLFAAPAAAVADAAPAEPLPLTDDMRLDAPAAQPVADAAQPVEPAAADSPVQEKENASDATADEIPAAPTAPAFPSVPIAETPADAMPEAPVEAKEEAAAPANETAQDEEKPRQETTADAAPAAPADGPDKADEAPAARADDAEEPVAAAPAPADVASPVQDESAVAPLSAPASPAQEAEAEQPLPGDDVHADAAQPVEPAAADSPVQEKENAPDATADEVPAAPTAPAFPSVPVAETPADAMPEAPVEAKEEAAAPADETAQDEEEPRQEMTADAAPTAPVDGPDEAPAARADDAEESVTAAPAPADVTSPAQEGSAAAPLSAPATPAQESEAEQPLPGDDAREDAAEAPVADAAQPAEPAATDSPVQENENAPDASADEVPAAPTAPAFPSVPVAETHDDALPEAPVEAKEEAAASPLSGGYVSPSLRHAGEWVGEPMPIGTPVSRPAPRQEETASAPVETVVTVRPLRRDVSPDEIARKLGKPSLVPTDRSALITPQPRKSSSSGPAAGTQPAFPGAPVEEAPQAVPGSKDVSSLPDMTPDSTTLLASGREETSRTRAAANTLMRFLSRFHTGNSQPQDREEEDKGPQAPAATVQERQGTPRPMPKKEAPREETTETTADIPATTNPWIERRTAPRPVAPTPRMPVPPMPQRPQPPDDPEDPLPALMWRMDKYLAEAGYALEQRRLHLVADAAGRLAAEAESYGFRVLGRMARCVESAGRAKDLQAVTDLLPELATAVERHRISMGS